MSQDHDLSELYDLIPLRAGEKIPLHRGWRAETPMRPDPGGRRGCRLRADQLVVDVDPRNGGTLESLGLQWLPPTVETPGGGWHLHYALPPDCGRIRHTRPDLPGVEFKTDGRFVVAPGSPGYEWDMRSPCLPAPVAPEEILALCRAPEAAGLGLGDGWTPGELAAALDCLAVEEFGDHDPWFQLMCACHEATGGEGLEEFTRWSTGDPRFASHTGQIANRWASLSAGRDGNARAGTIIKLLSDRGSDAPPTVAARQAAADFAAAPGQEAIEPRLDGSQLEDMCRRFKAVDEDGKLRVYSRRHDETLERSFWVKYARKDFIDVCRSVLHLPGFIVQVGDKEKFVEGSTYWLDNYKKKETYQGIVFAPEHSGDKTPDGKLNLWRGFAVEPSASGSWDRLKDLLFDSLCGQDIESHRYVMNWMARAVQMAWEPGGTAVVFRGKKGTGKSTLGRYFVKMFGQHGMQVTSPSLLTGRFNAHLRDICALFADEAFWAGDKSGEGVLKGLVTERSITYEGKGTNAETGRNCVHLVMASNEHWVVPAGTDDERRYAVFEVQPGKQPKEYWDRLHGDMARGGLAAMLHELMNRPIDDFNVFDVPQTAALATQKIHTLGTPEQWLVDFVMNDYRDVPVRDGNLVLMDDLEASIDGFYRRKRFKPNVASIRVHLGMLIMRMLPTATKVRFPADDRGTRAWGYRLPPAHEAKRRIEAEIGLTTDDGEEVGHGPDSLDTDGDV